MSSVNSRDIKHAVSRLRHLPGFFLRFLCSHFFPCDLRYIFRCATNLGTSVSPLKALSDFSHPVITTFLEFCFWLNGRQNRTSGSSPKSLRSCADSPFCVSSAALRQPLVCTSCFERQLALLFYSLEHGAVIQTGDVGFRAVLSGVFLAFQVLPRQLLASGILAMMHFLHVALLFSFLRGSVSLMKPWEKNRGETVALFFFPVSVLTLAILCCYFLV